MVKIEEMGIYLAERRRKLKYTQEMVAEIVGVTDKTIRNIEYGNTMADFDTIMMLWDLYRLPGISLFSFYNRSDVMNGSMCHFSDIIDETLDADENIPVGM